MATKPLKKGARATKAKAAPAKAKAKKVAKKSAKPIAKKPVAKAKPKKAAPKTQAVKKAKPTAVKKAVKPVVKSAKPKIKKAVKAAKPVVKKPVAPKKSKPVAVKPVAKPITKVEVPKPIQKTIVKKETKPVINQPKQPVKINGNSDYRERTRYSDEELQEFRELIQQKLEIARNELKYLQEQISRSSEMGDDSDARFKGLEDGTSTSEREYLSQMASRQIQYIGHLEKALIRIENKTYGICRETGKLISKERLRAVPHATLSIEAKQGKG